MPRQADLSIKSSGISSSVIAPGGPLRTQMPHILQAALTVSSLPLMTSAWNGQTFCRAAAAFVSILSLWITSFFMLQNLECCRA